MKTNILKNISITVIFLMLIWLNFPENYHLKLNIGNYKIDQVLNPPIFNTSIFGVKIYKDFKTKLGLDLQGGSHLVFEADTTNLIGKEKNEALESAKAIIERRVNFFGVSEPSIRLVKVGKSDRLEIDLPGLKSVEEAIGLIGQTAQLEFMEEGTQSAQLKVDNPLLESILRLNKFTGLSGKDVKKASPQPDSTTPGSYEIALKFDSDGTKKFEEITARNVGKQVGIFLDGTPLLIPTVNEAIRGGEARITGKFSLEGAKQLSIAINSGALPVKIKLIEQRSVGPTLGEKQIRQSVLAGVVGIFIVILYMIGYYGRLGLIAALALIIYGLINFAIIRTMPIILTLPGIAGLLLSIGMAVDSNILIFERTKEEMRAGKPYRVAINSGFGKAIDAIKDANFTTLLVAFILFNPLNWSFLPMFGLVRGFALTLAIGVVTSLFTGLFITKRLINIFGRKD